MKLIWDSWNKQHIQKHTVSITEVEEVYHSRTLIVNSYLGRQMILGETKRGRLLTIVVSALDMSKKERSIYHEEKRRNETSKTD